MYGYFGTMRTHPDRRDEVVAILLEGTAQLGEHGCHSYVVGIAEDDPNLICVSELWDRKDAHDASLQMPEVRAAISRAMPMLTGEFTGQQMEVRGGLGLPNA